MTRIEISPTIVPGSLEDVKEVSGRYASFSSRFQIDITDGHFAPNTTWLPKEDFLLPSEYTYEAHLMIEEPREMGTRFARAGAARIIGHAEALPSAELAESTFSEWKRMGAREAGLAVLLQTPFERVEPYLPHVDFVLLMTIARIGVQGIPYEARAPERIKEFHTRYPKVLIAVDGGVSEKNIADLVRAGASRFGVGSAISKAADSALAYDRLKILAEEAVH
jgi:ribulose-phosphate 3-epimerase